MARRSALETAAVSNGIGRGTIWALTVAQVGLALVTQFKTMNPVLGHYQYSGVSERASVGELLAGMKRNADHIKSDWPERPTSRVRPPRILTYAAGQLPYILHDAYVFEVLVSYRHQCWSKDQALPALRPSPTISTC